MSNEASKKETKPAAKGLKLRQQRTASSAFETFTAPEDLKAPWQPRLEFKLSLSESKLLEAKGTDSEHHKVFLGMEVIARMPLPEGLEPSAETEEQKVASKLFSVSSTHEGIFQVIGLQDEEKAQVLNTLCLELLFPYMSARLSEAVLHAGYPPIYLQPMNFSDIYRQKLAKKQEQRGSQ